MNFRLKIVTSEKKMFDGEVSEVMFCGSDGYFTLLANHTPFVARLVISSGYFKIDGKMYTFSIKGGFTSFLNNECVCVSSAFHQETFTSMDEIYQNTVKFKTVSREEVNKYFNT